MRLPEVVVGSLYASLGKGVTIAVHVHGHRVSTLAGIPT